MRRICLSPFLFFAMTEEEEARRQHWKHAMEFTVIRRDEIILKKIFIVYFKAQNHLFLRWSELNLLSHWHPLSQFKPVVNIA